MKKIFVFMMLAILIVGLTPVFGAGGNSDNSADAGNKVAVSTATNIGSDESLESGAGEIKEQVQEKATFTIQEKKGAADAGNKEAVKEMKQIKAEVKTQAKTQVQERKTQMLQIKQQLTECKDNYGEDCREVRKQARVSVKNNLMDSAGKSLKLLEQIKSKISESDLDDAEKADLTAKIDEKIELITAAKDNLDETDATTSNVGVKEAMKKITENWKKAKNAVNMKLHEDYIKRFAGSIEKVDALPAKLEQKLAELSAEGYDVSSIDLSELKSKIEAAKTAQSEANAAFEKAKSSSEEEQSVLMATAREKIKECHSLLSEAKESLKNTIQEMKGLKKAVSNEQ